MLDQQRQTLEKVQEKLFVLRTLNDAFHTALNHPALETHTITRLTAVRVPVIDFIAELRRQETSLIQSIEHLESRK